ncbi:MAG: hypothetical protein U0172_09980 [Nitrospiraceae bacterium]
MSRSVRHIMLMCLLLATTACAFGRGSLGEDISPEAVRLIQKGTTTKDEVLKLLGAPDRIVPLNGRDLFQYYRYDAKAGSLLLILVNFSRIGIKSDDVFVVLNREGIVEDVIASKRTEDLSFRFWPFGS